MKLDQYFQYTETGDRRLIQQSYQNSKVFSLAKAAIQQSFPESQILNLFHGFLRGIYAFNHLDVLHEAQYPTANQIPLITKGVGLTGKNMNPGQQYWLVHFHHALVLT